MTKTIRFWIPVIVWAAIIFLFSSHQTIQASGFYWQDFLLKKTAHFVEYFTLFVLIYRALKNTSRLNIKNTLILSLAMTVFYAFTDEIHQTFVPSREGTIRDVIIDSTGAATAMLLARSYLPRSPKRVREIARKFSLL